MYERLAVRGLELVAVQNLLLSEGAFGDTVCVCVMIRCVHPVLLMQADDLKKDLEALIKQKPDIVRLSLWYWAAHVVLRATGCIPTTQSAS